MCKPIQIFKIFFLLSALVIHSSSFAQKTKISGKIYDAETLDPLPFVNISFKGGKVGTTTNVSGYFQIETYYSTDSLVASCVGYKKMTKRVRKDKVQVLDFPMQPTRIELSEIIIKAKKEENPAHKILRRVIANKKINNKEKLDAYQYEVYSKIEFDLNNFNEKYKKKRIMRPFQFVFDYVDTTEAKPFLPMFMTEAISNYYYRKNPKSDKELLYATQVSGVNNQSVMQFLSDMYQNVNVYNNYVNIFQKSFVSPISDIGLFTYRYYLLDSAFIGNSWCYMLKFIPKRKHEMTFSGDMWINDTTYAIKKIDAKVSLSANINFIKEFAVAQEFEQVEDEVWMLVKDRLLVDFTLANKSIGFYGRKTATYRDFVINQPKGDEFFFGPDNLIIADSSMKRTEEYWENARHEELSQKEKDIYAMVDTIMEIRAAKTYYDIINMLVLGYKVWGKIELGPYSSTYSFNQVEGSRFRLGGRTSNDFSKRLMLEAYMAYGTRDQKMKYGGGFQYFLSKKPRTAIGASYNYDLEQLGEFSSSWGEDNFFATILRRNPSVKLNGYEDYTAYIEREWFIGFSHHLSFTNKKLWSVHDSLRFIYFEEGSPREEKHLITSEFSLLTRFAYKEKYFSGEFERISLGTKYPILQVQYTLGTQGIFRSEYDYHKLVVNIEDRIRINPFGFTRVILEGGKVWGNLPYPLLVLHSGNETFAYDITAFNLMNYYEFVSDKYVSVAATHHFQGLFLNKIPLMRKLKWREVLSVKSVAGNLSADNQNLSNKDILNFPVGLSSMSKPYVEAGIGIENIFKLLRIDLLWRLAYINDKYVTDYESKTSSKISKLGIRGFFQLNF